MAMFVGQHMWYPTDITSGGDEIGVPCGKCHADIYSELQTTITPGDGGTGAQAGHQGVGCEGCHIAGIGNTNASRGITGQPNFHAAATTECVECHNTGSLGTTHDVVGQITGARAAHQPFYEQALNDPLMSGANEACVACHTHVRVDITWTHPANMTFNATEDGTGTWTVGNFATSGTVTVNTVGERDGTGTVV